LARACERYLPDTKPIDFDNIDPLGEEAFEAILNAVMTYDSQDCHPYRG